MTAHTSCVYVGLAGDTGPGRVIKSGLYRMAADAGEWEIVVKGLPELPAIRAIAVHPQESQIVYVGTQEGPYRSTDHGDHWEKVDVPDHGLPVWSLLFHPCDANVMYAGYENCEIYRSEDMGETWCQLPVSVRFPEVTMAPGANPDKRVLMLSGSASDPGAVYGAVEVGGVVRTLDGGEHWENLSHGQYLNDDTVDTHGVLASSWRQDTVYSISRAGMFSSTDRGEHWLHVSLEPLNAKGQVYCRDICEAPGDPRTVWVAAGSGFRGDVGVLFRVTDGGSTWERVNMSMTPQSTMFALSFDEQARMYCATKGGEVFASCDGGGTWSAHPLPEDATQVYALACG